MQRPAPIRTRDNAFAHHTMRIRVPGTVRETAAHAPADYQADLLRLADEMAADAVIPPLTRPAPDYADWMAAYRAHDGDTWLDTEWWFAEVYLYRLIIEYTRWYETGIDPFAHKKAEELASPTLWKTLDTALAIDPDDPLRLEYLIDFALWGNRIDLSLEAVKAHGTDAHPDDLLVDERAPALAALRDRVDPVVHLIADNTGSELALDFALVDALLDGLCPQVIVHLKYHPTFVSDATLADATELLARLADRRRTPYQALAERLNGAILDQRLILRPDLLWNSARFLWDFPADFLHEHFGDAALVIVKGDANYRRLVGDALWPPETPFAAAVGPFPAPLLALRTLKSDPIVGLRPGQAEALDAVDPGWRTNGRRGVIQFRPRS